VAGRSVIGGSLLVVDLSIMRSSVPSGSWTGRVLVGGSGPTQLASTQVTIANQEPLWPIPALVGGIAALGGVALAALKLAAGVTGMSDALSGWRSGGAWKSLVGWLLTVITFPIKLIGSALAVLLQPQNLLALLLGFGAGLTAFLLAYQGDASWAVTLGSVVALTTKVGGASLAAAFAVLEKQ